MVKLAFALSITNYLEVYRVSVKGTGFSKWLEASFQLSDGAKNVCHEGKKFVLIFCRLMIVFINCT